MINIDPKIDNRLETVIRTIFVIKIAFSTSEEEDDEEDNSTMVGVLFLYAQRERSSFAVSVTLPLSHTLPPSERSDKKRGKRKSPSIVERVRVDFQRMRIAL